MASEDTTRRASRRDALRVGGAAGVALAAGVAIRSGALAQDATPEPGGISHTIQTLSLATAVQLIEAAEQASVDIGVAMAIAIVDHSGMLKAFHRMDGLERQVTVDLVQSKAYTAASFRTPTHMLAENASANPAFLASVSNIPGFTLIGGGYPISDGEVVVGGIGVGGGSAEQDMQVAEAALASLGM
jgi:uncharacterized protein GlcG (DUF336 family)